MLRFNSSLGANVYDPSSIGSRGFHVNRTPGGSMFAPNNYGQPGHRLNIPFGYGSTGGLRWNPEENDFAPAQGSFARAMQNWMDRDDYERDIAALDAEESYWADRARAAENAEWRTIQEDKAWAQRNPTPQGYNWNTGNVSRQPPPTLQGRMQRPRPDPVGAYRMNNPPPVKEYPWGNRDWMDDFFD